MRLVIHPFVVHFPIALLLMNQALTIAALRRDDPLIERSAYGALVIGWWGTLAATLTGTLELALHWPLRPDTVAWINAHAALGLILLAIYGQALLRRRRDPRILHGPNRNGYLTLLAIGAGLVLLDGWIGGHLVHDLGFGIR